MHGSDRLEGAVAGELRAPLWELVGSRRYGFYDISRPGVEGLFLPAGRGDRWIYGTLRDSGEGATPAELEARIAWRVEQGIGVPGLPVRIERVSAFSFAAQVAERFRHERVFLVGDAAHRVTPRGGTGLNSALYDGYDLGWKLGWVLRGWAHADVLDTYEAERRPVVERNVARSAVPNSGARSAEDELPGEIGGRVAHVWVPSPAGPVSTLDLLGSGLTVFTGLDDGTWRRAADAASAWLPIGVHALDALSARALGVPDGGALLARPDGRPAGSWPGGVDAAGALAEAVAAVAGRRAGGEARLAA
jgi:hypothetical protein